jgi:two-component system, NtrC family, sensor kinase
VSVQDRPQSDKLLFLEQLKEQWMAMIDSVDDALVILNESYEIQRINVAYFQKSFVFQQNNFSQEKDSFSIRDLKNKKCYEVFAGRGSPCDHCQIKALNQASQTVSWSTSELFNSDSELQQEHFDIRARSLPNKQYVVHYRNVTDIKTMQESLARADKLSALGHMAGGVAHEINSPLAGILVFAQMALSEMDASSPHFQDLKEIEDAARKCKVIVESLLGFARQEKPKEKKLFSIIDALESTIRLGAPLARKHKVEIVFQKESLPKNVIVEGHIGKLEQVFLNIITNASYSMRQVGGEVLITITQSHNNLKVNFQDSGEGINPKSLSRIFDPFYTTKPFGEGTGLGLSVSYSHVKQMGGSIEVSSVLGEGSVFEVILPVSFTSE